MNHISINIHPLTTKQWILKCLGIDRKKLWTYNRTSCLQSCSVSVYVDSVYSFELRNIDQVIDHMAELRDSGKKVFINLIISEVGADRTDCIVVTLWNIGEALYLTLSGFNDDIGVLKNLNNVDFKSDDMKKYNTLRAKVRQVLKDHKELTNALEVLKVAS